MRSQRRTLGIVIVVLLLWQFWHFGAVHTSPIGPIVPSAVPAALVHAPLPTHQPSTRASQPPKRWIEKLLQFYRDTGDEDYCTKARAFALDELMASDPTFTPQLAALIRSHYRIHDAVAQGTPAKNQTYLIWSLSGGLGNRFQSLVSTFMLALLSGRVLLLKDWFTPLPKNSKNNKPMIFPAQYTDEYQLEALEKLFWFSNPLVAESSPRPSNSRLICPIFPMMTVTEFQQLYPHHFGDSKRAAPWRLGHVKIDLSARHDKKLLRWSRVACGNVSNHAKDSDSPSRIDRELFFPETFVYIWTNQYFLPLLFANPYHGERMRELLPTRPYSTLLRLLVLPSSEVMRRVALFFDNQVKSFPKHPLNPGQYVALQIRAFSFPEMPDLAKAFLKCFQERQLPEPFFLASMHEPIRSVFSGSYNATMMRVQSEKAAGDQHTGKGAEADIEALVDMLLLALSKRLFLSPGSTFGTFAAAFGEVPAVRVNWKDIRRERGSLCEALPSLQPCFGSWHKYDHIFQRSNLGTRRLSGNDIPCALRPLPVDVMFC